MSPPAKVTAILVAAGRGRRYGGERPKQFQELAGAPLLGHGLASLSAAASIDAIVLVVPPDDPGPSRSLAASFPRVTAVVRGGATRRDSVAAGLAAAPPGTGLVLVHDAARPLATTALAEAVLERARRDGAAVPALPVRDTLKRVEADRVAATVSRESLVAVQTPQAFRLDWLLRAHQEVSPGHPAPDDASLLEALGLPVSVVPGEPGNLKVTEKGDLALAEALLRRRQEATP